VPLSFESILPHAPVFALVMARLTGMFLLAPIFSSVLIPRQARVMLVLSLAMCIYPALDHSRSLGLRLDVFELLPVMAGELLVGAVIGLLTLLPMMAVQLSGLIMGQQMGLGLAQVVNPATDIEGDNIGQMLFLGTMALFLQIDGLELLFGALVETFHRVPPGGMSMSLAPVDLIGGVLSSAYVVATRVALPVLAILTLESASMALLMKTVPSINIMTVGFPIRVLLGLIVLVAGLATIGRVMEDDLMNAMDTLLQWARSLPTL
jgi:flagellar biosynthetic protein FliR